MTENYILSPGDLYGNAAGSVTRASDRASIPDDDRNRDWRAYLAWCAEGNTPDPIPAPVIDPAVAERKASEKSARDKIATTSALTADEESAMFGNSGTP